VNSLVDMYAKAGDLECTRKVFERIPGRNVVSWTSMLSDASLLDMYVKWDAVCDR